MRNVLGSNNLILLVANLENVNSKQKFSGKNILIFFSLMNPENTILTESEKKLLLDLMTRLLSSQLQPNPDPSMENKGQDHLQNNVGEEVYSVEIIFLWDLFLYQLEL